MRLPCQSIQRLCTTLFYQYSQHEALKLNVHSSLGGLACGHAVLKIRIKTNKIQNGMKTGVFNSEINLMNGWPCGDMMIMVTLV